MELIFAMAPQGGEGGGMVSTIIMFGAIFLIFYFMIIRPQQKKAKDRDRLLSNLEKHYRPENSKFSNFFSGKFKKVLEPFLPLKQ